MPNHTRNKLVLRGPEEAIGAFVDRHVRWRETEDASNRETDLPGNPALAWTVAQLKHPTNRPCFSLDSFVSEPQGPEYSYPVPVVHGFWAMTDLLYDWCLANWGTKWEAYDGDMEIFASGDLLDSVILTFATAWNWPRPIYEKLPARIASDPAFAGLEIDVFAFCEGWHFALEGRISAAGFHASEWTPQYGDEATRRIHVECYGCTPEEDEAAAEAA